MLYLWLCLELVNEVKLVTVAEAFLELHENFEQFLLREFKILFDSPEDYFDLLLRSLSRETIR